MPKADPFRPADTAVASFVGDGASLALDAIRRATSPDEAVSVLRFLEGNKDFLSLKTAEQRRKYLAKEMREVRARQIELAAKQKHLDRLLERKDAISGMIEWAQCTPVLQKPDRPLFRELRRSVKGGEAIYFSRDHEDDLPATDFENEVFREAEILVIEHDWAAALSADDDNAPINLPFDVCAFEFRISGYPVIAMATQFGDDVAFSPVIGFKGTWILTDFTFQAGSYSDIDEGYLKIIDLLSRQIRAVCIALDAEVAVSEPRREPHDGQRGNSQYALAKPYHVVSLTRRSARATECPMPASPGRGKRLHFRRGHWRHYSTFKTWVKWCLVGNPELGFIDKHYKL